MWIALPGQEMVPVAVSEIVDKEADVLGVFRYANVYPLAVRLAASGQVDLRPMVTHTRPLELAAEALAIAADRRGGAVKVMITP